MFRSARFLVVPAVAVASIVGVGAVGGSVAHADVIVGDGNDNVLTGTPDDDTITGAGGDDTIDGAGGRDIIYGDVNIGNGSGDDTIDGGDGNDTIFGDAVLGNGSGNDALTGGAGVDVLYGQGGHDVVCGDADDDVVSGGAGTDLPCATVDEADVDSLDGAAVAGSVNIERQLDDEALETNPIEYVVLTGPTQGTVVLSGATGAFAYTPDEGAVGMDQFTVGIRRLIDGVVVADDANVATMTMAANGDWYIQDVAGTVTIRMTQTPPVVVPEPPAGPAVETPASAASTTPAARTLPATGSSSVSLMAAMGGLLVAAGAGLTRLGRRDRDQVEYLGR